MKPMADVESNVSRGCGLRLAAFTVVELLGVVSIISILVAILLPTLGASRSAVLAAKTRVQFAQWCAAIEQFRQEYGYYPDIAPAGGLASAADTAKFVRTLSGRNVDGSDVAVPADLNGNKKRIAFYVFADGEFADSKRCDSAGGEILCDAFGNTEIGLLLDRNGDGVVKPGEDCPVFPVTGVNGGGGMTPTEADLPSTGLRAGVLIYSAGRGGNQSDLVLSWK
jgi:type II secretory pathway pseudopilin PulG